MFAYRGEYFVSFSMLVHRSNGCLTPYGDHVLVYATLIYRRLNRWRSERDSHERQ